MVDSGLGDWSGDSRGERMVQPRNKPLLQPMVEFYFPCNVDSVCVVLLASALGLRVYRYEYLFSDNRILFSRSVDDECLLSSWKT